MDDRSPISRDPSPGSSRSSLAGMIPGMHRHIITEYNDAYNPGALPRIPLRVPQKASRQSLQQMYQPTPYVPSSPTTTVASTFANNGHISPPYKEEPGELDRSDAPRPPEAGRPDDEKHFDHRKRSQRFLILVGVITLIVIVGLAVGLTLGLKNKVSTQGSQADTDDNHSPHVYPAGSFSFETGLDKKDTGCTSKDTTWLCEPEKKGDTVTFYWDIKSDDSDTYRISSKENAFAPPFNNVSMKLLDENKYNERLVFSFSMNKTVTPSDVGSPTNRAAKCTYHDTKFQATLYTRKRGRTAIQGKKQRVKYSSWPGDIKITQIMNSTIGEPVCEDAAQHVIADVQAAQGTCECQYSNANIKED